MYSTARFARTDLTASLIVELVERAALFLRAKYHGPTSKYGALDSTNLNIDNDGDIAWYVKSFSKKEDMIAEENR